MKILQPHLPQLSFALIPLLLFGCATGPGVSGQERKKAEAELKIQSQELFIERLVQIQQIYFKINRDNEFPERQKVARLPFLYKENFVPFTLFIHRKSGWNKIDKTPTYLAPLIQLPVLNQIQRGNKLTKIDGVVLSEEEDLRNYLKELSGKETVMITFERGSQSQELKIPVYYLAKITPVFLDLSYIGPSEGISPSYFANITITREFFNLAQTDSEKAFVKKPFTSNNLVNKLRSVLRSDNS